MGRGTWSLGDIGFVGALLGVLTFQGLRHEAFESEKLGLLLLCCVLMVADLLTLSPSIVQCWRKNPVILAVVGLALVTLISSAFALSPQRALVGSGFRSYGWLFIACEALLVLYVAAFGARLRTLIAPLLALIAVPVCLYALYQVLNASSPLRPGSTAANPNYLAAWLGLCFVWVMPSALAPLNVRKPDGRWLLTGLWTALVLVTLNATGSRAAFIGLIIAGSIGVMLWGALRRHRGPLIGMGVVAIGIMGLLAIMQSGSIRQRGLARLLEPVDDFRLAAWTDSLAMVQAMPTPLIAHSQQPDRWAGLRPLIGYGLDNIDTLRVRTVELREVTAAHTIPDRMHSLLYDTLLSTGLLGLMAQGLIFEALWLSLIARMHLLSSRRDLIACIGLQGFACVAIGVVGQMIGWPTGVRLVLALIGLVVGMLIWLALIPWRRPSDAPIDVSPWLIGLFCGSVFYFVCHLFGFQQLVCGVLFAALLGFCAIDPVDDESQTPQIDTLFLVLAVVTVFTSSLLRVVPPASLLIMIGIFVGGWAAALWFGQQKGQLRHTAWQKGALYAGGLVLLMLGSYKARESLSLAMNQTLLAAHASSLTDLIVQAGGHGALTLLSYGYTGLLIWQAGRAHQITQSRRGMALTLVCLMGACVVFLAGSTGHILWNTASALDSISGAQYAAEMSYQGAEQLLPWTLELRAEHLRFLRTPAGASLGIDTTPLEQALYALDPFYDNQVRD